MKQEIIDKYGLIKTDVHNGESFRNNIVTYQHPRKDIVIFMSTGDPNGRPLKDGIIGIVARNESQWITFQEPEELLLSDTGGEYLNDRIKKYLMTHKEWLDNEYSQWIKALQESTVHNFKEHPMVKRMLSCDIPDGVFVGKIDLPDYELTNLIYKIDCIGRKKELPFIGDHTRRMLYYAKQIIKRNPSSICEIGGGVGQFYAILRALGYKGDYHIFDLPEVKEFQNKYLAEVEKQTGLRLHQIDGNNKPEMIVSFYALGEFDNREKEFYKAAIDPVEHGYIVWNPHSGASDDLSIFDSHKIKVTPGIEAGIKIIEW